jgi:hypothetical protein
VYRIFDQVLDSSIDLPELDTASGAEPDIRFELRTRGTRRESGWKHVHDWTLPDGTITISCARRGDDYRLSFPQLAEFHIGNSGDQITCYPEPGTSDIAIRHLLLDQVIPRVMGHGGRLVVHASAVVLEEGSTAAFLGDTGWGKSTLAAALQRHGATMLTDDSLLLERRGDRVWGIPAYRSLRLLADSTAWAAPCASDFSRLGQYGGKQRMQPRGVVAAANVEHIELSCLFLLSEPGNAGQKEQISIEPVAGGDALLALIARLFTLDVSDDARTSDIFFDCGRLLNMGLPVFGLDYPRKHDMLPEVCNAVIGHVERNENCLEIPETRGAGITATGKLGKLQ